MPETHPKKTTVAPIPSGIKPDLGPAEEAIPAKAVVLEYTDEKKRGIKLFGDGTVETTGYEADPVSLEIFGTLLAQFSLLSQIQSTLQAGLTADLKGKLKMVVATGDDNLDGVEMYREALSRANRAYVLDVRRRAQSGK